MVKHLNYWLPISLIVKMIIFLEVFKEAETEPITSSKHVDSGSTPNQDTS